MMTYLSSELHPSYNDTLLSMKKIFFVILMAVVAISCTKAVSLECSQDLLLSEGWTLSAEGMEGTFQATVPSTVAGALYEAGYFQKDLFESDNYAGIDKSIFDNVWTYATDFKVEKKAEHYTLIFDGLNYYADIFLNGTQIASSDTTKGVFIKRSYDVTDILKGSNTLEVKIKKAAKGDLNIGYVDWNPRPADESMGIIRPVHLHAAGTVEINDVYVKPSLDTDNFKSADLEVMVTLSNNGKADVEGTLSLALENSDACTVPFKIEAGKTEEITLTPEQAENLHIDNPRVWWTWDMGTPELYDLTVSCIVNDAVSDYRTATFGVREFGSYLTEGNYRQFTLNGKDILVKGAGWTDDIFLRDTHESIELQVNYVKDMNMNCIRFENIWGKDDFVYDLCDRYGLLAMVGWSCQWEWEDYCGIPEQGRYGCIYSPELIDLAVNYFHDQVIRLHNHASIFAWLTGSDGMAIPELDLRYKEIFDRYDYRPYVCSAKNLFSTTSGWSGTKMDGPYEYVGPEYWYLDTKEGGAFGFNTETCVGGSFPQKESLVKMIPADSLWPISSIWDFHCTASSSAMNSTDMMESIVNGNYGGFNSLDDFLMKAYAVDYNGTRAMFEAFRVNIPNTTGIIQWMLNSAWPSMYWQVYDWYGAPTAGYYGIKKACEPVQLIFNYKDRKVYVVNESGADVQADAEVKILDANSSLVSYEARKIETGHRSPAAVFDLSKFDGQPHFVSLSLTKESGERIDNFYCIAAKDNVHDFNHTKWYVAPISEFADQSFAFPSEKADVSYDVTAVEGGLNVTLVNNSERVSYMNILKAKNAEGELVVPAFWSDNFLPLLPGETKNVSCRINGDIDNIVVELESR